MKTIILMLIYVGTFAGMFLLLSMFGMLWRSYVIIVSDPQWFIAYTILFGWWVSIFPAMEYYSLNKDYFKDL